MRVDVSDADAVAEFGRQIAPLVVDNLLNNASKIGPEAHKGESGQNIESLDPLVLERLFKVSAIGPLMLTKALRPSLHKLCFTKDVCYGHDYRSGWSDIQRLLRLSHEQGRGAHCLCHPFKRSGSGRDHRRGSLSRVGADRYGGRGNVRAPRERGTDDPGYG